MKLLTGLVAALALANLLAVLTAIEVLSNLGGPVDFALEPLVQGDLRGLFASRTFWNAFPALPHPASLIAVGPMVTVLVWLAGVVGCARRLPHIRPALWAAAMLAGGCVPYAVGAVGLGGNTVPEHAGPWLVWMLHGPAYAAVAALLLLRRWPRVPADQARKIGYQVAAVS